MIAELVLFIFKDQAQITAVLTNVMLCIMVLVELTSKWVSLLVFQFGAVGAVAHPV
jgi:hypothetical protein